MPEKRWKRVEKRVAALFGTRRRRMSGSDMESGGDDIVHDRLHVEVKHRQRHGAVRAFKEHVVPKARKEGKLPVLVMAEVGKPGLYLLCPLESNYLKNIAAELDGGKDWYLPKTCTCGDPSFYCSVHDSK